MAGRDIPINPLMLRWARERASYSLEDAASRAKLNSPRKRKGEAVITPAEQLERWENGEANPTLTQLEELARIYRRPLITFFLPQPPKETDSFIDFRTLPSQQSSPTPEFNALKRKISLIQRELREIAIAEGMSQLELGGTITTDMATEKVADIIARLLNLPERRSFKDKGNYFNVLRDRIQDLGIYVLMMGDLSNYRTQISPDEFRGLALADKYAPMIIINKYDARAANIFTLIHELVHILLGNHAISNSSIFEVKEQSAIETFCNAVTGEFLVPKNELMNKWQANPVDLENTVNMIARHFKVSNAVIAKRLLDIGKINYNAYSSLMYAYRQEWEKTRQKQKSGSGGPAYDTLLPYRFGKKLITRLKSASENDLISFTDAARILDIPFGSLSKLFA